MHFFLLIIHLQVGSTSTNNNNNANEFELYSNDECLHATPTKKSTMLNKQASAMVHGNVSDEHIMHNQQQRKEIMQQPKTKCKQSPTTRTNNVHHHHHKNGMITAQTHLTPTPSNHPLAQVINSLSSPESAYSTGYSSTDGTSPSGTINQIQCNFILKVHRINFSKRRPNKNEMHVENLADNSLNLLFI